MFVYQTADPELAELGIHGGRKSRWDYRFDYIRLEKDLEEFKALGDWDNYYRLMRNMSKADFFFFCYFVLDYPVNTPFLIARCYEIQDDGDHMMMDMWAREHWKTTLKSIAYNIWRVAKNADERIGFFCYNRTLAKAILGTIMSTLEESTKLQNAFPDVFYSKPDKQSRRWSLNEGCFVKQRKKYKEATFSAWGLVDGMPIGWHFTRRIYDDIVTEKTVGNALQVKKAFDAFRLSDNLGSRAEKTINGTRYHHKDPYSEIMKNHRWKCRVYPAEVEKCEPYKYGYTEMNYKGKIGGKPIFYDRAVLDDKLATQHEWMYSAQNLLDPIARKEMRLHDSFLRYRSPEAQVVTNKIMIIDTARKDSKKESFDKDDYTVMWVIGIDFLKRFHVYDCIRDKLSLKQKWEAMSSLVRKHKLDEAWIERHGSNEEKQYYEECMEKEGLFFTLEEINTKTPKHQRIENLATLFMEGRIIFPRAIPYKDLEGEYHDLISDFLEDEYRVYPFVVHDDMLDTLAYVMYDKIAWKIPHDNVSEEKKASRIDPLNMNTQEYTANRGWMAQ